MSRRRLLFVPLADPALDELVKRADLQRRRPQDEAALLLEWALKHTTGIGSDPFGRIPGPKKPPKHKDAE